MTDRISVPKALRPYLPRWSARVVTDFSGRDPLGLSSIAHLLTGELLPGIITTTNRARYYSIYCWILWHIGEVANVQSLEEYVREFQRREAAFAIGTVLDPDCNLSPVGITAVNKQLDGDPKELSLQFRVLPSNPYGGYGANYSGCMYELGLWRRPSEIREEVTPGIATDLALAVEGTLAGTAYERERLWEDKVVAVSDLQSSAPRLSLGALANEAGAKERALITDLLFGLSGTVDSEPRSLRRQTLALVLWLVAEYESRGLACPATSLEDHLLYWPVYHDSLAHAVSEARIPCRLPAELSSVAESWRQFCMHGYLSYALEQIMTAALSVLEREPSGLPESDLLEYLLMDGFEEALDAFVDGDSGTPAHMMATLRSGAAPQGRRALGDTLSEDSLARVECKTAGERLANGVLLLAILQSSWRDLSADAATTRLHAQVGDELWVGEVLPSLEVWSKNQTTWHDALCDLISRFIVNQHDVVMYSKGRLESCWLHSEAGRLHFDQDLVPQFRASRIPQAVSMLIDLNLLAKTGEEEEQELRITHAGREALGKAMELCA